MDLLNQYLAHIERNLSPAKRADIVAEIADEIKSQFEEREASLGRPLTRDEAAEIIRAYGNPRTVAGRYAEQQYLIGPELLPFYWYVLKVVIVISLGLLMFGSAIRAIALNNVSVYFNGMAAGWETPLQIIGIVTIIFALLQHFGKPWPQRWDPRTLPPVGAGIPVSRILIAFEFIVNVALLLILLTVVPHWVDVRSRIWQPIYVALIIGCSINALALCGTYIQPDWGRLRLFGQVAANAANIVGLVLALHALAPNAILLRPLLALFLAVVSIAGSVALWKLIRYTTPDGVAKFYMP